MAYHGVLYGTTRYGGLGYCKYAGCGTVFSITASGTLQTLHKFRKRAYGPMCRLVASKGELFGTTLEGGAHGYGTVFEISTTGAERTLYSFRGGRDGSSPHSLAVGANGLLYGTTQFGGNSGCNVGSASTCGTVFSITTTGQHRVLYAFKGGSDGSRPIGDLLYSNGALYGTTASGGISSGNCPSPCGTVFKLSPAGQETVLYRFKGGNDGAIPLAGLTSLNGLFYGTTEEGGGYHASAFGSGAVFAVSPSGHETIVYRFMGVPYDGSNPQYGSLTVLNGDLYGTTEDGGYNSAGTIFKVTRSGRETVLHSFGLGQDGSYPYDGVVEMSGYAYGTTFTGGEKGPGIVFRFKP